VNADSIYQKRR